MSGSAHFKIYEHNLQRVLLFDWLRKELVQRDLDGLRRRNLRGQDAPLQRPYWLVATDHCSAGAA